MKKQQKLEVEDAKFIYLKKGDYKIRCVMTDKSVWEVDKEIKEWKCIKPSDKVLNEAFQEYFYKD